MLELSDHQDEHYRNCFTDGMYLTGDLVRRDADGYHDSGAVQ
jgi:non-ribosomal peptide synthetase component E (peptide arylation enzyme)